MKQNFIFISDNNIQADDCLYIGKTNSYRSYDTMPNYYDYLDLENGRSDHRAQLVC